jgi:hypothetical protein
VHEHRQARRHHLVPLPVCHRDTHFVRMHG